MKPMPVVAHVHGELPVGDLGGDLDLAPSGLGSSRA
jgi:hypothetical protein